MTAINKDSGNMNNIESPADEYGELYVVSVSKFLVLYVITMGAYAAYWSYRNWRYFKGVAEPGIMPLVRAFFWPFFIFLILERVSEKYEQRGELCRWHPGIKGWLIIASIILPKLSAYYFASMLSVESMFVLDAAMIAWGAYLFVGVQCAINQLVGDPQGARNSEITNANIVWIIVGGVYWVFALGIFFYGQG